MWFSLRSLVLRLDETVLLAYQTRSLYDTEGYASNEYPLIVVSRTLRVAVPWAMYAQHPLKVHEEHI